VIIVGTKDIIEPESEGDPPATLYVKSKNANRCTSADGQPDDQDADRQNDDR